jgi:arsenite methyltransferase
VIALHPRSDATHPLLIPFSFAVQTTAEVAKLLRNVHPDVHDRFYGCGSPIPPLLRGLTTLDLGCGTGRDTYLLAQLVGSEGRALGVDMTPEQLEVAEGTVAWHAKKFGFEKPNTQFIKGDISDLKAAGIEDESVDIVVSNCVLNLAADKEAVFREIFRVLKPGGELYFSDIYADRRIPDALQRDKVLWGEVSTTLQVIGA